ncbi:HRDC domain-containing protein [Holdemania massiliensis]|uniref:HRDC domain-containing protein n=1 Tax=Holdemania massiliensis TaxID=1468449 RepID=UPI00349EC3A6
MRVDPEPGKRPQKNRASRPNSLSGTSYALFEELRRLRARLAKEESLPPYVIFSDKTLIEISCRKIRKRC